MEAGVLCYEEVRFDRFGQPASVVFGPFARVWEGCWVLAVDEIAHDRGFVDFAVV